MMKDWPTLRKPLTNQTRKNVSRAGRREWNNHSHRPRWITLRCRDVRREWQRGSTRGQTQKLPAGNFQWRPPCARVNARGRAMRAWIDRTNDGLSGMPADGIGLPPKKEGPRHVPLGHEVRLHQPLGWAKGSVNVRSWW